MKKKILALPHICLIPSHTTQMLKESKETKTKSMISVIWFLNVNVEISDFEKVFLKTFSVQGTDQLNHYLTASSFTRLFLFSIMLSKCLFLSQASGLIPAGKRQEASVCPSQPRQAQTDCQWWRQGQSHHPTCLYSAQLLTIVRSHSQVKIRGRSLWRWQNR